MNEEMKRLEDKVDKLVEANTKVLVHIGTIQALLNGGVGNSAECLRHRDEIGKLQGQLQRWGGGLALLVIIVPIVSTVIIKLVWK